MIDKSTWAAYGSTSLFVLLWGSGAIFSRWGLDHSSAFAFLILRFALALFALAVLAALARRSLLPPLRDWPRIALTGALLIGGYTISYFLALENGITPGAIATVLGVQPVLTMMITERDFSFARVAGLLLAIFGLVLVVLQSLIRMQLTAAGAIFALLALASITAGAILQKRTQDSPIDALPLHYIATLAMCLLFAPFKPLHFEWSADFFVPLLWLGLVISVGAQLLLYRLIHAGNLVNVTSLFYLVPVVTAIMDYLFLGNVLPKQGWFGMAAIICGLALVMRGSRQRSAHREANAVATAER